MNGSSSVSSASQTIQIKTEPVVDAWSKEDCLTLLERIRSLLPDGDAMKYKTTESHFDWEKVCFGGFTGDMCKQKWAKVSTEVRKFRTMTELIVDAIEFVKNPYKGKKLKTHPDFPKKPLTPYFRFFMEKRAKYAKIHPEMSNLDLTKILSKKYKELPDKKKQKYITEFQREKESFEKNMARFKEDYPELIEERKKSDLPEKPKTPQQLWYNHEKKTYMKLHPDVSQKELKEALRRQWSQLSDKKRLKWISKALELQKDYAGCMRVYQEAHPDAEEHVKSVLTKAERQLKDKFDGRPTKPPPNGYSLYCAELMVNMKDVPSTERMVLCSKQWKVMTQKEKDMFQKRCEQKKKQYEIDLQRFLESLPEEERDRVMTEEKLGGSRLGMGGVGSPHRSKSPSAKERCCEAEQGHWVHSGLTTKEKRDGKKRTKLPETPKTAEEMWQQGVVGDYLAKYRSDRKKTQSAMESAWKAMEKKEKIPWIKKAAEDQKRYEVQYRPVRELLEMRTAQAGAGQRKPKFEGEPRKPPVSGYQMFSQELLTNGELNHFSLKERMVEIGKRWHKLSQSHKDKYKKLVEELQIEYKAELEAWVKSLSPQERAVYKEFSTTKRRSTTKVRGGPGAKVRVTAVKGKAVGARAAAAGVGGGKRAMAYRAKVTVPFSSDCFPQTDGDTHRQALNPDTHRQALNPDTHRHALNPDTHRHALNPDTHRQALNPDTHRQALNPDTHTDRHALNPDTHTGTHSIQIQARTQSRYRHALNPDTQARTQSRYTGTHSNQIHTHTHALTPALHPDTQPRSHSLYPDTHTHTGTHSIQIHTGRHALNPDTHTLMHSDFEVVAWVWALCDIFVIFMSNVLMFGWLSCVCPIIVYSMCCCKQGLEPVQGK